MNRTDRRGNVVYLVRRRSKCTNIVFIIRDPQHRQIVFYCTICLFLFLFFYERIKRYFFIHNKQTDYIMLGDIARLLGRGRIALTGYAIGWNRDFHRLMRYVTEVHLFCNRSCQRDKDISYDLYVFYLLRNA